MLLAFDMHCNIIEKCPPFLMCTVSARSAVKYAEKITNSFVDNTYRQLYIHKNAAIEWKGANLARSSLGVIHATLVAALAVAGGNAQTVKILDPLVVSAQGDSTRAIVSALIPANLQTDTCDVVVIGAGLGGSAAAMTVAQAGHHVCMTEPTHWIGGQMTSQGVSAFDENRWIDSTGATASYTILRNKIRDHYRLDLNNPLREGDWNPGNCWVSALCFEPSAGLNALQQMLDPFEKSGKLTVYLRAAPVKVEKKGDVIESAVFFDFEKKDFFRLRGSIFIDATELGEFLPLADADYVTGAESRSMSNEPDAPAEPHPDAVQSFTYPFILRRDAAPNKGAAQPQRYEENLSRFTLDSVEGPTLTLHYHFFNRGPHTPGAFWTYRRSIDASQFKSSVFPSDLSMINWSSNDVCDSKILSNSPEEVARAMQNGKQVALGFAWWIAHDAPHDDGHGKGYADIAVVPQAMGSGDGLSQFPYVREARRIVALQTIRAQEVAPKDPSAVRAMQYDNSVGIGYYPMDIHACGVESHLGTSKPYQIPLAALLSRNVPNLMAAAKNIGTTHFTNGAYRLHPTEWAVGVAAGQTAHLALTSGASVRTVATDAILLRRLQFGLIQMGQPLVWYDDISITSPLFVSVQALAVLGVLPVRNGTLHFSAELPITAGEVKNAVEKLGLPGVQLTAGQAVTWEQLSGLGHGAEKRHGEVRRGAFTAWVWRLLQNSSANTNNSKKEK